MKRIGFTNFRRFEQFPVLDIDDITFIVGSNNSGKSTMVKAILLVYDNLRSLRSFQKDGNWEEPKFKFDASKTRDLHIGTFWRALNNRAKERGDESISFVATLSQITYEIKVNCNLNHDDDLFETMAPIASITITDLKNHARFVIDYAKNQLSAVVGMNDNAPQTISDSLDKFISFAYNNDMVNRLYALSTIWEGHEEDVRLTITDVLASLSDNYIEYFYAHGVTQKIVYSYEDRNDYIASIIHEYENERKYFEKRESNFMSYWMNQFGIAKDIKINSVSGSAFSVVLFDNQYPKDGINLVDLGMGYIQLILLLLKLNTFVSRNCRKSKKTTMIIIEEPEQNLHPRLQSLLTQLFYEINREYGIRLLIETHSEYIIRAAQVKVGDYGYSSQEQLNAESPFRVYYFPEDNELPYDMEFTPVGAFKRQFGKGFFDEAGNLSMTVMRREDETDNE